MSVANEGAAEAKPDTRACSCYPGEGPLPCPRKHALRDCWRSAVLEETERAIIALKSRDRHTNEQSLLDYLMRVRFALELETATWPAVSDAAPFLEPHS